tara:strand:- start:2676 stop:3239 length:564 start_codon:yes stop_codon:yes gene_type:complete
MSTRYIDNYSDQNRPVGCGSEIPLHNLGKDYFIFIWHLPLDYAGSVEELAEKFHEKYKTGNYPCFSPPKYRGVYRNPKTKTWVVSSAFYCGSPNGNVTTQEIFDNLRHRMAHFAVFSAKAGIKSSLECICSGDNYRSHCKYIKDAIEMLELEYDENRLESLLPIRSKLHRLTNYKPHLTIIDNGDQE